MTKIENWLKILLLTILVAFVYRLCMDNIQCEQKCQWKYGFMNNSISGIVQLSTYFNFREHQCICTENAYSKAERSLGYISIYNEKNDFKWFYNNVTHVCAMEDNEVYEYEQLVLLTNSDHSSLETDSNHSSSAAIWNCGKCGKCSNANDIQVFHNTSSHLSSSIRKCSVLSFIPIVGCSIIDHCMQYFIGFTPECSFCMVQNIMCTMNHCSSICIKQFFMSVEWNAGNGVNDDAYNDCLLCDEQFCGAQFIECAGANRRTTGIVSDIQRDSDMICPYNKQLYSYSL